MYKLYNVCIVSWIFGKCTTEPTLRRAAQSRPADTNKVIINVVWLHSPNRKSSTSYSPFTQSCGQIFFRTHYAIFHLTHLYSEALWRDRSSVLLRRDKERAINDQIRLGRAVWQIHCVLSKQNETPAETISGTGQAVPPLFLILL